MLRLSPASAWALGARLCWRHWRAGEWSLLCAALCLAVTALTTVSFLSERLQEALQRDAATGLGGDLVLRSDRPLSPEWAEQAQALGLQGAQNNALLTMARLPEDLGQASRLVTLKAVAPSYPLRGELRVAARLDDVQGVAVRHPPAPGTVWAEAGLLSALGLQPGQSLCLGERCFVVERVLLQEPDRAWGWSGLTPRVLLPLTDLPSTQLVQAASRVEYRSAWVGAPAAVQALRARWEQRLAQQPERGLALETLASGRPDMQQMLDRTEKFLQWVAGLALCLSMVAVLLAARLYVLRHWEDAALWRVLGIARGRLLRVYGVALSLVALGASAVGVGLGYVFQAALVWWWREALPSALPPPSWAPAWLGLAVGVALVLALVGPWVWRLAQVPPAQVLRQQAQIFSRPTLWVGVWLGLGLLALGWSDDAPTGDRWVVWALLGFFAVGGLFAAVAWVVVLGLKKALSWPHWPVSWRLAARQWTARPGAAVLQIAVLSLGLLALLLLWWLRTDLLDTWQRALPVDAPNRFVINLLPEQTSAFEQTVWQAGLLPKDRYPMVKGRWLSINQRPVRASDYRDTRAQRLIEREFNLGFSQTLPEHNPLTAGRWRADDPDGLSLEQGLADTLGVKLGDRVAFEIAGEVREATVTSLRRVDWTSMRVNFFALYPTLPPPEAPVTHIAALHLPVGSPLEAAWARQFPNVTVIDLTQALSQLQRVLSQVVPAVQALFALTLVAGGLVMLTTVVTTRAEREREWALWRALGATQAQMRRLLWGEWWLIGALAGGLAATLAWGLAWGLARWVLDLPWQPRPTVWAWGVLSGIAVAWLVGAWGLRGVTRATVVTVLQRGV